MQLHRRGHFCTNVGGPEKSDSVRHITNSFTQCDNTYDHGCHQGNWFFGGLHNPKFKLW